MGAPPSGPGDPGGATSSNNGAADLQALGIGSQGLAGAVNATASRSQALQGYELQGVYFKREWFKSVADCLTAAAARHLPLQICE